MTSIYGSPRLSLDDALKQVGILWKRRPLFLRVPKEIVGEIDRAFPDIIKREKALVLVHSLLNRMRKLRRKEKITVEAAIKRGVPINAKVNRRILGEKDERILKTLVREEVVRMTRNYKAGERSRSYWFSERFDITRTVRVEITNKRLCERLVGFQRDRTKNLLKLSSSPYRHLLLPAYQEVLINLVSLRVEGEEEASRLVEGENRKGQAKAFKSLCLGRISWFSFGRNGRISHAVAVLPAPLRQKHLRLDGERLVEWDIPASHPAFIVSELRQYGLNDAEFRRLRKLLQNREFYEYFEVYWKSEDEPKGIKVLFQRLFQDTRVERSDLELWRGMKLDFPSFVEALKRLKLKYRRRGEFADFVHGKEARLIADVMNDFQFRGIRCFPVFDSIAVPLSRAEEARKVFNEILSDCLGYQLSVKTGSEIFEETLG